MLLCWTHTSLDSAKAEDLLAYSLELTLVHTIPALPCLFQSGL